MTIALQSGIIYGPLRSRRFGVSLGVNLLPVDHKVCNMDCVYCQYGSSSEETKSPFPEICEIGSDVEHFLGDIRTNGPRINWIMLSGNGEPTLHPQFPEAVNCLLRARDAFLPRVPVGILSNSSTCHAPGVRQALSLLEGRFMKLDAGNLPGPEVLAGLRSLKDTVLQSLFYEGTRQNTDALQVGEWIDAVTRIRPESVQVYTIDRPTRIEGLCRVPATKLMDISSRLSALSGIPAESF